MFWGNFLKQCAAIGIAVELTFHAHAQINATLTDLGAAAPIPGPLDITQLSTNGNAISPDGLNYYTDNQTEHNAGEPGQTFTTPNGTNGFMLTALALKSAGLNSGGGSPGTAINYVLHIYSVSGGNVTLLASYITASAITYTEGDWLQWTGLSVRLSPGATYAYSFGKAAGGNGWDAIGVAGGNPYAGGEIALIPPAGGAMTFGGSHSYDATFDIGLIAAGPAPTLADLGTAAPTPGALDIVQFSTNGNATFPDGLNYYTDNQTDHNAGEPGQTFTTPNSTNSFILALLAFKSAGLDSGGGSPGGSINYVLHIYSVSGGNVTPLAGYTTASPISYAEGDWLQWSNLSVVLLPNTTYAYSFGKANSGGGWDAIGVAGGNPYAGGEIALVPPAGGAMTFGGSHSYDATFDIGLISAGPPTPPVVTNLPATGIQATAATLNGRMISTGGSLPIVSIYYGTTDGGTNAGAWQHTVAIGGQPGAFALTVPGLSTKMTYFFTSFASNSAGGTWAAPSKNFTTVASNPVPTLTAVLTYHNDNSRDGANTNETGLTPANVNAGSFGCLFSYAVDGYVYAQPLVMTNVNIPGKGTHNVVYVATEHDTVYAFDADDNLGTNGGLLWQTNLGVSGLSSSGDFGTRYHNGQYTDLVPEVGITGTPVIDPASGTIYFDAFTLDSTNNGVDVYHHRIHALDIATGNERPYSPVIVAASVPGTGVDSSNGVVTFNAVQQLQRPGLTLAGGQVYVAYGSYADTDPYHGWVLGFNAANLQLAAANVYNTTPNATVQDFGANA